MNLLNYIKEKYAPGELFFVSDLYGSGITKYAVRQQIKYMTDKKQIKKYRRGTYYIPYMTFLGIESTPSIYDYIKKKYMDKESGYYGMEMAVNYIGLSTQIPNNIIVYSNKATTNTRIINLNNRKLIIKKPKTNINSQNVKIFQLLEGINYANTFSDYTTLEWENIIKKYIRDNNISKKQIKKYISFFPKRTLINLKAGGIDL